MKYITTVDGKEFTIEILDEQHVIFNGVTYQVDFETVRGTPVYSLLVNGRSHEAYVSRGEDDAWEVMLQGDLYNVQVEDEREKRLRAATGGDVAERGEFHLKAPMPGLVVAIPVKEGQEVEKGDVLVVLESMKMQNELKAPRSGTVSRIRAKAGDNVEQRQTILSIE